MGDKSALTAGKPAIPPEVEGWLDFVRAGNKLSLGRLRDRRVPS